MSISRCVVSALNRTVVMSMICSFWSFQKSYAGETEAQPKLSAQSEEDVSDEPIKAENLGSKEERKNVGKKLKKDLFKKLDAVDLDIHFFPDWPVSSFDYFISPIVGFASEKKEYSGLSRTSTIFEAGMGLALTDIPVVPKNPGFTMDLMGGKAWGGEKVSSSSGAKEDLKAESSSYQRVFGKIYFTGYYHALRWKLGVKRGRMEYGSDLWEDNNSQSFGIENDLGFLILPFFSGHYTLTMDRVWQDAYSDPFLVEYDHWLHGKIASSTIKTSFDLGPGYTTSKQTEASTPKNLSYDQSSSYVKAQFSSNPFWKFTLLASAKYILSKEGEVKLLGVRLPEEGLYDPKEKGLPADSLAASWFIGFNRLLGGMGAGYQVNLTITDMRDKTQKSTTRTSGWVVNYSIGL